MRGVAQTGSGKTLAYLLPLIRCSLSACAVFMKGQECQHIAGTSWTSQSLEMAMGRLGSWFGSKYELT